MINVLNRDRPIVLAALVGVVALSVAIAVGLRPLLALPVEHVLATHGGPTDRAALERALSATS